MGFFTKGSGGGSKVKTSSLDLFSGYLKDKLVEGTSIVLEEVTISGKKYMQISASETGTDGSIWTSGTSAPAGGNDNDFYLKTDEGKIYQKESGIWNLKMTLSSGGGTWGSITGTLSSQTDLSNALGNKVDKVEGKGLSTNDYTTDEKNKLSGIASNATANDTDANLKNRANHTGTQSADTITDGTTNKAYTATEKTKLGNISGTNTGNETVDSIGTLLNGATTKGSIVSDDKIVVLNSEDSGKAITVLFSTLKAALKTYFDTLYSGATVKATEVTVASNTTLTVANVSGTIINNYGQGAATVTATLPAAEAGLNFVAIMGTTQGSYQWKIKAGTNDKIFLDGTAGIDNQCAIVTPEQGNAIHFFTFKTGSSSWDWKATTLTGVWTAGA